MGNSIIGIGIAIIVIGVLYNLFSRFGLPTLPGDILIKRDNFTFYFPVVSSILISIVLTIILNIFTRR